MAAVTSCENEELWSCLVIAIYMKVCRNCFHQSLSKYFLDFFSVFFSGLFRWSRIRRHFTFASSGIGLPGMRCRFLCLTEDVNMLLSHLYDDVRNLDRMRLG